MTPDWSAARGDLLKLRYIAQTELPDLETAWEDRWRAASRWTVGRQPGCLVHCSHQKGPIAQAHQTPVGILVAFLLRPSDLSGYAGINGRRIPSDIAMSGWPAAPQPGEDPELPTRPATAADIDAFLSAPDQFVPEELEWCTDVLPWPTPLPQPATLPARCRREVHDVDVRPLLELALTAPPNSEVRRMRIASTLGG